MDWKSKMPTAIVEMVEVAEIVAVAVDLVD